MDYSKMSDFEINKLVAESSSVDCCVRINFSGEAMGGGAEKWLCRHEEGTKFDPCNNPADAWPIIVDNLLRITPVVHHGSVSWIACRGDYGVSHENPLRAAMIVFLMMQESANVQDNPARNLLR